MKVIVTNTTALNAGDAAILESLIARLREAFGQETEIICYDSQPAAAAKYYPNLVFKQSLPIQLGKQKRPQFIRNTRATGLILAAALYRFPFLQWLHCLLPKTYRDMITNYAAADLIVSTGGTYLVPHYDIWPRLVDFLVALALGRPLGLYTQSLGPFHRKAHRLILRFTLARAVFVFLRDQESQSNLDGLAQRTDRIMIRADAAFAHARVDLANHHKLLPETPQIGVSVRSWSLFRRNKHAGMGAFSYEIARFIEFIVLEYNATVIFLSTCQGRSEYWTDDAKIANQILLLLPAKVKKHVSVDSKSYTPEQLRNRYANFDCLIATRMHAAILGLCAGTPVIPIAYEFKTRRLFERLGLESLVIDIEDVTSESLKEKVSNLFSQWEVIQTKLWPKVRQQRASALDVEPLRIYGRG